MKTDMSPYGVTELTPEKGDRNVGKVVLAVCGSSWRNGGVAAVVALYAHVGPLHISRARLDLKT